MLIYGRLKTNHFMGTIYDQIGGSIKNWWISLLVGLIFIGVGLWMVFRPSEGYIAFSIIFSITILVSGIAEIFFAAANRHVSSWGWYLVSGIIDIIIGIVLISRPMLTEEVIPFIVAFWLMFRGFSAIGYAVDLRRYGTQEWGWYIAFGILSIICSLFILWQPLVGAFYVVYMIAFTFLIIGSFRVMLSFELRTLHKKGKQ